MAGYEWKKLLRYRRGGWIVLVLLLAELASILLFTRPFDRNLEENRSVYNEYLAQVEGPLTPEKREWIRQICEHDENLRKVVRKMSEMTMDFEAYFRETKAIMAELERADRQREWLEQGKRMGKQEGLEQGIERGLERGELCKVIKLVLKNMKKGKSISEIAEILDEDETVIRQIFICHEEHPEWTADQIATRIRN